MILVKPSVTILTQIDGTAVLKNIERAGRTCYKSEDRIEDTSAILFCRSILARGHESVLEHEALSVRFVVDRGVSHELVRHRLCAFSQESTRYCNYRGGVTFIIPPWVDIEPGEYHSDRYTGNNRIGYGACQWFSCMENAEAWYKHLLEAGWSPQQARSVLPNSLKTEIVCTANMREWRHILRLRTAKAAHPQMREVMVPLLASLKEQIPVLFDDIATEAAT